MSGIIEQRRQKALKQLDLWTTTNTQYWTLLMKLMDNKTSGTIWDRHHTDLRIGYWHGKVQNPEPTFLGGNHPTGPSRLKNCLNKLAAPDPSWLQLLRHEKACVESWRHSEVPWWRNGVRCIAFALMFVFVESSNKAISIVLIIIFHLLFLGILKGLFSKTMSNKNTDSM